MNRGIENIDSIITLFNDAHSWFPFVAGRRNVKETIYDSSNFNDMMSAGEEEGIRLTSLLPSLPTRFPCDVKLTRGCRTESRLQRYQVHRHRSACRELVESHLSHSRRDDEAPLVKRSGRARRAEEAAERHVVYMRESGAAGGRCGESRCGPMKRIRRRNWPRDRWGGWGWVWWNRRSRRWRDLSGWRRERRAVPAISSNEPGVAWHVLCRARLLTSATVGDVRGLLCRRRHCCPVVWSMGLGPLGKTRDWW